MRRTATRTVSRLRAIRYHVDCDETFETELYQPTTSPSALRSPTSQNRSAGPP
ncbi:hypothetical protein ACFQ69_02450 [Streptomyces sp. NPDC056470]|uniref:hypothetical protein n=1 Tax=Streptomyces sp. NPDC056470 TaxID=3345831 RepID=UPI0036912AA0